MPRSQLTLTNAGTTLQCLISNKDKWIVVLSLRFEVALMHIPYTVEFINKKLTNRIDF